MERSRAVYEQPLDTYRRSYLPIIGVMALVTPVVIAGFVGLLVFTPFIPEDYFVVLGVSCALALAWMYVVIPFDGRAMYKLTAYAFDADNKEIGASEPIIIKSVDGEP